MKTIEIDDELYHYIAGNTQHIGESASSILRRLLQLDPPGHHGTPETTAVPVAASTAPRAAGTSAYTSVNPTSGAGAHTGTRVNTAGRAETLSADAGAVSASAEPVTQATDLHNMLQAIENNQQKAAVRRFLSLLSGLYQLHPELFSQVLEIRGRNRLYFALSEDELLQTGRSTNPMAIPGSPYWVIGNTNTERKREILSKVLKRLGYDAAQQAEACDLL